MQEEIMYLHTRDVGDDATTHLFVDGMQKSKAHKGFFVNQSCLSVIMATNSNPGNIETKAGFLP
jgi:hypothetical protein